MSYLQNLGRFEPFGAKESNTTGPPPKYFLFERSNVHEKDTHEEEIYISNKTVIWSAGGLVKKKFTMDCEVLQVSMVCFVNFRRCG